MPRFAANLTMMFTEWDFLDRFSAAADAGFKAVECLFPYDFTPDQVASALSRNALTQALFNFPPGDWSKGARGLAALPERRADFLASIDTALSYAAALDCRRLHVLAGVAPDAPANRSAYRDAIVAAVEAAAPRGITILLEPIADREIPGYFMNDFAKAVALIQEIHAPNLKLQYDIYHRQILHGDVLKSLEALMPLIGHVQTASVPARNEPGSGELDDARIFAALDALGYDGWVGCEYRPRAGTLAGLGWRDA